jgi:hypothetical protein
MSMIQVSTARQSLSKEQKATHWEVFTGTRQTTDKETGKKKEIPEHMRARSIIVPVPDVSALPSKFSVFVSRCLMDVSKSQLAAIWEDKPEVKEVAASLFTTDGLLAFAAREAESKRLTAASIKLAVASFILTVNEKRRDDALLILTNMAAATKTATEKQCMLLLPKFSEWVKTQDEEKNPVSHLVLEKLTEHIEAKKAERLAFDMEEDTTF